MIRIGSKQLLGPGGILRQNTNQSSFPQLMALMGDEIYEDPINRDEYISGAKAKRKEIKGKIELQREELREFKNRLELTNPLNKKR